MNCWTSWLTFCRVNESSQLHSWLSCLPSDSWFLSSHSWATISPCTGTREGKMTHSVSSSFHQTHAVFSRGQTLFLTVFLNCWIILISLAPQPLTYCCAPHNCPCSQSDLIIGVWLVMLRVGERHATCSCWTTALQTICNPSESSFLEHSQCSLQTPIPVDSWKLDEIWLF